MENDEPCVLALYRKADAPDDGYNMVSCYGVRPASLVQNTEGDPHHPVHGILSVGRGSAAELNANIQAVKAVADRNRLLGWVVQSRRVCGSADTVGPELEPSDRGTPAGGAEEHEAPPFASPPQGYKLRCRERWPNNTTDNVSLWKGYWERTLPTSRVTFGCGRADTNVDVICAGDLAVQPRHAALVYEGNAWSIEALEGTCMVESHQGFDLNPREGDHAPRGAGKQAAFTSDLWSIVFVEKGERRELSRERPCFTFPNSRFTFKVEWPGPEAQDPTSQPSGAEAAQDVKGDGGSRRAEGTEEVTTISRRIWGARERR